MTAPTPAQTRPQHDPGDLVTEEMVTAAYDAIKAAGRDPMPTEDDIIREEAIAALRAVAPMIAARALLRWEKASAEGMRRTDAMARQEERERCAQIAEDHCTTDLVAPVCAFIASEIRARGET
jgi:hypothetical protein